MSNRNKITRYCKHMTEGERQKILAWFRRKALDDSPRWWKYYFIVRIMDLGLRVGEVVRLLRSNFDEDFTRLTYLTEKTGRVHERELPYHLTEELRWYWEKIHEHRSEFLFAIYGHGAQGDYPATKSVQRLWADARKSLGLIQAYHEVQERPYQILSPRTRHPEMFGMIRARHYQLHRVTCHTNRHHAGDRMYALTKDSKACADELGIDKDTFDRYYLSRRHLTRDCIEAAFLPPDYAPLKTKIVCAYRRMAK